ncbi:unnamed protein product [Rodentolepis nana]|uniref:Secreted protein n=1 Tax=Rodentolepis nana TaxID=102285 RepID=A0A0R3TED5_RODNA|nr:unnamed protein product [Rodentolepis nana]
MHVFLLSGCRILLNLLCLPEVKCLTSSNSCPICYYDLSTSEGSTDGEVSSHDLCDVYHGLTRLRRCLEVSETNGGRSIEQWIRDIDAFIVDACAKFDDLGIPSVSTTFREAAGVLRDTLDSSVSSHYPAFFQV